MLQLNQNIIELEYIDSTNNYLSKLISTTNVPNGTVILTRNQTKGRGQRKNRWVTKPYQNITFSVYLKYNKLAVKDNFLISIIAANSIHQLTQNHIGNVYIKWPNDILIKSKKTAGILIENNVQGQHVKHSVIGIGINVNQDDFEPEFNATSFSKETEKNYDLSVLTNDLLSIVSYQYRLLLTNKIDEIKSYYFANLYGYKKDFEFKIIDSNKVLSGKIVNVEYNGLLVVKTNSQIFTFSFKEIEFLL